MAENAEPIDAAIMPKMVEEIAWTPLVMGEVIAAMTAYDCKRDGHRFEETTGGQLKCVACGYEIPMVKARVIHAGEKAGTAFGDRLRVVEDNR